MLKTRKLLILLNEENAKNTEFTQLRYTPSTRKGVDSLPPHSTGDCAASVLVVCLHD